MEIDKRIIKNLKDLKSFYKKGIRQAQLDNKQKLIPEFDAKIKELSELIEKYS